MKSDITIVTAASEKYADSLRALIGSVRSNWSADVPIHVYDLGLADQTLRELEAEAGVAVKRVPEFCPHWRLHYTWKLWILNNAEADSILWLDAGIFVLKPLNAVVERIRESGIFLVPNYQDLAVEAPPAAVYSCGLTYAELGGRSSISANILGLDRSRPGFEIFKRAFELGRVEANLKAIHPRHKHDQALLSCVLYSIYPDFLFCDGQMFAGWRSAAQVNGQLCWAHRRAILPGDIGQLRLRGSAPGGFRPRNPADHTPVHVRFFRFLKGQASRFVRHKRIHGLR